jgi:hypothetical protein
MTVDSNTPTSPPRRRPSLALKLMLLGASMVFMLIALELGMRIFMTVTDVPLQFWDPVVGVRRIPNQSGRFVTGSHSDAPYRFNAQGWNHRDDYVTVKPPGARRVCVVGDSFVEALNVPYDDTFFGVAEKVMSHPGRPVQWYAYGCSGFGTTHESLVIQHYALDYHPDVVLILFIGNDPTDSSVYLAQQEPWVSRYELDDGDQLVLIPSTQYFPSKIRRFFANFAIVRYFMIQKRLYAPGQTPTPPTGNFIREAAMGATSQMDSDSLPERVARTWLLIEKVLERTRQECERRGAVLGLVWEGDRWEVESVLTGRPYKPIPVKDDPFCTGLRSYSMGRQYVEPLAKKLNIPYYDLTQTLSDKVRATGRLHHFPDDAHWNSSGHAAVGEALARWVETLWPKDGSANAKK